jgi:hypothetical protein
MKSILLLLSLFIVVQGVLADTSTPPLTIKRIETGWGSEGLYIQSNEGAVVEGCTSTTIRINSNHLMFDHIVSIALSAYHTKSKVQFRVSGCLGSSMKGVAIAVLD